MEKPVNRKLVEQSVRRILLLNPIAFEHSLDSEFRFVEFLTSMACSIVEEDRMRNAEADVRVEYYLDRKDVWEIPWRKYFHTVPLFDAFVRGEESPAYVVARPMMVGINFSMVIENDVARLRFDRPVRGLVRMYGVAFEEQEGSNVA